MSLSSALRVDTDFDVALAVIRETLRTSWGVDRIVTVLGEHGVDYIAAEDSEEPDEGDSAIVGFVLPRDFFAQLDYGTYGQMQGFRVFRSDLV